MKERRHKIGMCLGKGPCFGLSSAMVRGANTRTTMALLKEIWIQDVQEQLALRTDFLRFAVDHSPFIRQSIVHVPQAGVVPVSVKNRAAGAATVLQRTDADLTYPVYARSTDPVLIPDLDTFQLSYDKRQSIMQAHLDRPAEDAARDIITKWAPTDAGKIVRTSGADTSLTLAPGATGTRKTITVKDIARLAQLFDMDKVPGEERYLMLNPYRYYELFEAKALQSRDMMGRLILPEGVIGQVSR